MHIPDGFLSTPVWATLDVAAVPAAGYFVRRTQADFDQSRVPLLGVMGAFVFAAQMINFPVGVGTSGHLVGGALLACTLGPYAATVVMTAILVVQALVFQDGGVTALGCNVLNMAVAGVWLGYLPVKLFGQSRRVAVFLGGWLSLFGAALLATVQLSLSRVAPNGPLFASMLGIHAITGLAEAAITVATLEAIGKLSPSFVFSGRAAVRRDVWSLAGAAMILAVLGILAASSSPDGLERVAEKLGFASRGSAVLIGSPLADYQVRFLQSRWLAQASAGAVGVALLCGFGLLLGRLLTNSRDNAHHLTLDAWSRMASPIHRLDARAKILGALAILLSQVLTHRAYLCLFGAYFLLISSIAWYARLPVTSLTWRASLVVPFAGAVAALNLFGGNLMLGAAVLGKSFLSAYTVVLLLATTPLPALLRGLESLGVPRFFLMVAQFLHRYLFILFEQAQHMTQARKCRAPLGRRTPLFASAAGAVAVLFARSYARAERIHRAMLARGFQGHFVLLDPPAWHAADSLFIAGLGIILLGFQLLLWNR